MEFNTEDLELFIKMKSSPKLWAIFIQIMKLVEQGDQTESEISQTNDFPWWPGILPCDIDTSLLSGPVHSDICSDTEHPPGPCIPHELADDDHYCHDCDSDYCSDVTHNEGYVSWIGGFPPEDSVMARSNFNPPITLKSEDHLNMTLTMTTQ